MKLTRTRSGAGLQSNMFDWHMQACRGGQPHDRPSTHSSPESAIEAGNGMLNSSDSDEITVYHRLHSNQACLVFATPIPTDEIRQKAAHLEKQAQLASRSG